MRSLCPLIENICFKNAVDYLGLEVAEELQHDERSVRSYGEVAVVIGGTGALGGAMADALAEAAPGLRLSGRNQERGDEARQTHR